jgi:pimeloyl-ACP methyl ester carboxylesterase
MKRRHFIQATAGLSITAVSGLESGRLRAETRLQAETKGTSTVSAREWHAVRRFVSLKQGRIAYVEKGRGEAALFMHGLPLSGFQWRDAFGPLSAHRRCIAPDFLSLGYTEVAKGQSVTPESQVEMLAAFMDELSIETADIVASDSGGQAAQIFVAHHPQRVRSLLLTNCDSEIDSPPPAMKPLIDLSKRGRFVEELIVPWMRDTSLARTPQGLGGQCYANPANLTDEAIGMYFAPLVKSPEPLHAYIVALERNPLVGIGPALKRFAGPARIVWGAADDLFSSGSPDFLDRQFGNSRGVRRLEGSKLFWPEERPDVLIEEARSLWGVA